MAINEIITKFKNKYGDKEVKLPYEILTVYDSYASPFSSGSNGYITKVRVRNGVLEFYHNWWAYGWFSYNEMNEKYPCQVCKAISMVL